MYIYFILTSFIHIALFVAKRNDCQNVIFVLILSWQEEYQDITLEA